MMRATPKLLGIALLLLAGCYSPNIPNGQQMCSADGQCPDGMMCFADHRCYAPSSMPDCAPACSGATPICDRTKLKCVECLKDVDCGPGNLCMNQSCHTGCSADHPACAAGTGSCDVDMGVCRGCMTDAECAGSPSTPVCDVPNQRCVACLPADKSTSGTDTCGASGYCISNTKTGAYGCGQGCVTKADCMGTVGDGGPPAPSTMDCCNHVCVDTALDPVNCGGCGRACASGNACCGSACTDTSHDSMNCGACGNACMLANLTQQSCINNACVLSSSSCAAGFADCNASPFDGCEVSTATDPANCGGCGTKCPSVTNGLPGCKAKTCGVGTCFAGWGDCDGKAANGCETSTATDIANCGMCGNACPVPTNASTAGCTAGACGVGACKAGFTDCNKMAADGCEVATGTDAMNCGVCGNVCPTFKNTSGPACAGGLCATGACTGTFADCDKSTANGCEIDTSSDVNHCGKCYALCPPVANGVPGCSSGACGIGQCNANFNDCNKKASDGCESNALTDWRNCGGCNKACGPDQICSNGTCAAGRKVFVLSTPLPNGAFGGIAGGDAKCQAAAQAAGLPQPANYRAWLSDTSGTSPATRFTHPVGQPYVLLDNSVVAADWNALVAGSLQHQINLSETGAPPMPITSGGCGIQNPVWTDVNGAGTPVTTATTYNCNNWTDSTTSGAVGSTTRADSLWTYWTTCTCSQPAYIYCFEQ